MMKSKDSFTATVTGPDNRQWLTVCLTDDAYKVLFHAKIEAARLDDLPVEAQRTIDTGHILAGLAKTGYAGTGKLLRKRGIDVRTARQALEVAEGTNDEAKRKQP